MSDISKIKLPNGDIYNLKDNQALHQGDATLGAITGIVKENSTLLTIMDGASNYPIEELKITFGPHQQGSGDPSPENVRPISGWTGAKVVRANKMPTFEPEQSGSGVPSPTNIRPITPGLTFTMDNGTTLTAYGGTLDVTTGELVVDRAEVDLGTLNWSSTLISNNVGYRFYSGFSIPLAQKMPKIPTDLSQKIGLVCSMFNEKLPSQYNQAVNGITIYSNKSFQLYEMSMSTMTAEEFTAAVSGVQIVYPLETPITYHLTPQEITRALTALGITCNIYDVQFPSEAGMVYGGTLDVVNGVLTVDYKAIILNANTPCEEFRTQNNGLYTVWSGITDMASGIFATDNKVMLDRVIKVANRADVSVTTLAALVGNNNKSIYLYNMDSVFGYTTTEQISNWLAQNPITCTIKLATPLIYQLTPQQINTLLGENNIWANVNGTISIKYAADTKLFIQQNTVKDVQIDNTSLVNDGIATIPYASTETPGIGKINSNAGITLYNGFFSIYGANDNRIKSGNDLAAAVVAANQHTSTFYGLAKAAGVDERTSSNAIGTYTNAAKGAIQHMIGTDTTIAPYEADITADRSYAINDTFMLDGKLYKATAAIAQGGVITPNTNCIEIKLEDIYVKNTDYANSNTGGVVKIGGAAYGLTIENGRLGIAEATTSYIKQGNGYYRPLTSAYVPTIAFYGLAKAAGDTTQIQSDNAVGAYTDAAKTAICDMIGASNIVKVQDTQPTTPTTQLWIQDSAQAAVQVPTVSEMEQAIEDASIDVQINGTSITSNGVANIPLASSDTSGLVKIGATYGISINSNVLRILGATDVLIQEGINPYRPIAPATQHISTFYGLAKAAGDTTQAASSNAVGTYTSEAKAAIQQMIGLGTINASTVAATLNTTSKTYLLGTQNTITSTAANVSVSGDTGVYLTTNQGQISATQHSINVNGTEKAYMTYNTTDQSIDFIFI